MVEFNRDFTDDEVNKRRDDMLTAINLYLATLKTSEDGSDYCNFALTGVSPETEAAFGIIVVMAPALFEGAVNQICEAVAEEINDVLTNG